MLEYVGTSVFGGIAIGEICVLKQDCQKVFRKNIENIEAEIARFHKAKETAIMQLQVLYEKALVEVGETNAAIFEVHQMMLEDDDYKESVENIIESQSVNAEYAVATTADNFANLFATMEDAYMRERAADVRDISERLLTVLQGKRNGNFQIEKPVIIVAEDLAPSQTVQLEKDKVLAFVTRVGSTNSHTAILARTMGIPALIGCPLPIDDSIDEKLAVVDGINGKVYIEPDDVILEQMKEKQKEQEKKEQLLQELKGKESKTIDGRQIMLYANIGNSRDLATVVQNDAEGIGLFRSEFIYLERDTFPTEEEQFQIYKTVAETMAGKKVIVRTLDIGADKQCPYFQIEKEENPALGFRAIRICLSRPDIFKTQLRAIFRAAVYGNISIMYPMITDVKEVHQIQKIVQEIEQELTEQEIRYEVPEQGIMIETPAAALISHELAKEVSFFSIGTNDLTQYTLAIDRQNPKLEPFYDAHHPAVLELIRLVTENAHKAGIWVGICGELGADLSMTEEFLKMGIDELSVSPASVLQVRERIRDIDLSKKR